MCSNDEYILYADYTVLVCVGKINEELADHVIIRLRNLPDWYSCKKNIYKSFKIRIHSCDQ